MADETRIVAVALMILFGRLENGKTQLLTSLRSTFQRRGMSTLTLHTHMHTPIHHTPQPIPKHQTNTIFDDRRILSHQTCINCIPGTGSFLCPQDEVNTWLFVSRSVSTQMEPWFNSSLPQPGTFLQISKIRLTTSHIPSTSFYHTTVEADTHATDARTARARTAKSTHNTRSPSTKPVKLRCSPKESADTTASSPVTEDKRSPCFTRRPRRPRRSCLD